MIKATKNVNYHIKPINSSYSLPENAKLYYIDKMVDSKVDERLIRLERDISNYKAVFYSFLVEVEKNTTKLDELKRYIKNTDLLNKNISISIVEEKFCNSFEELIIKPILKSRYTEFLVAADFYKYQRYIIKNIVLSEEVINSYVLHYYNIVNDLLPVINKLDAIMFTNSDKIYSLFSKNIYRYSDIDKIPVTNKIVFLDLPFNIESIIERLNNIVDKNTEVYYINISSSVTLLDRDRDIIDIYNRTISNKLKIDLSFKSSIFTKLIDKHIKPNKFLKESTSLEVLKSWSKNL